MRRKIRFLLQRISPKNRVDIDYQISGLDKMDPAYKDLKKLLTVEEVADKIMELIQHEKHIAEQRTLYSNFLHEKP